MTQFLLSQYTIKKNNISNNNTGDKKGDKNKKDDNTKSEDKNNNTAGTVGMHVGEGALGKDKTVAPSDSSSVHMSLMSPKLLFHHNNVYKTS